MKMNTDQWTPQKAHRWFNARKWARGLSLQPHPSIDVLEFAVQYHANKGYWDKAFAFLKDADVVNMVPGKYAIDGEHVYVSVVEGPTRDIKDTKWEAHRRYVDIQCVVRGTETMGIAPVDQAEIIESFDEVRDIGFYNIAETACAYFEAEPGNFFIFFPKDAHRPGIRARGTEVNKKIIIKIVTSQDVSEKQD
jgi:YhcH/YjgK/YiaL family protein